MDREALIRAIAENTGDDNVRLVFADCTTESRRT